MHEYQAINLKSTNSCKSMGEFMAAFCHSLVFSFVFTIGDSQSSYSNLGPQTRLNGKTLWSGA